MSSISFAYWLFHAILNGSFFQKWTCKWTLKQLQREQIDKNTHTQTHKTTAVTLAHACRRIYGTLHRLERELETRNMSRIMCRERTQRAITSGATQVDHPHHTITHCHAAFAHLQRHGGCVRHHSRVQGRGEVIWYHPEIARRLPEATPHTKVY